MSLETTHLSLKPCSPAGILTLIEQPGRFEQAVGFPAAPGLREMFVSAEVSPAWLAALRLSPSPDSWLHGFFLVHREGRAVIGSAGFKGPPDPTGTVEIAYGIAASFEGQGYATEAAAALVAFAFAAPEVEVVRAHILPVANASTRVLAKCGFRHVDSEGQVVCDHRRLPAELEPLTSILREVGSPMSGTVEATLPWAWLQDRLTAAKFALADAGEESDSWVPGRRESPGGDHRPVRAGGEGMAGIGASLPGRAPGHRGAARGPETESQPRTAAWLDPFYILCTTKYLTKPATLLIFDP